MREYEINLRIKTKNRKVVDELQNICDTLPKGEYYSMETNSTPNSPMQTGYKRIKEENAKRGLVYLTEIAENLLEGVGKGLYQQVNPDYKPSASLQDFSPYSFDKLKKKELMKE